MPRLLTRLSLRLLATGLCLWVGIGVSQAQATTNVELAAMLGGRIVGAAKACGINGERIRKVSERMLTVMGAQAASETKSTSAKEYFSAAQAAGAEQMRFERSTCTGIHVDFSEIEVKLGRAPRVYTDPVVAKRGVSPIGALKTDPGATTARE